jgi:hypothetical protein
VHKNVADDNYVKLIHQVYRIALQGGEEDPSELRPSERLQEVFSIQVKALLQNEVLGLKSFTHETGDQFVYF